MVDYMEDAKRLLAVCETMLEQENPDVDPEVVCTTIKDAANEMALKIEKITREFRVNGWEYHSLIDQD
tara:strand:+ start:885 stop:1088 length:204 start_codon:yes stop_codon:yes gene_type:complete